MILYKDNRVIVCSLDGDTNFYDIGQRSLAPSLFHNLLALCSMNVNRSYERK